MERIFQEYDYPIDIHSSESRVYIVQYNEEAFGNITVYVEKHKLKELIELLNNNRG